jgi:hypothetical protein
MLRQIHEVYVPAFQNAAYVQYKNSLEQTLKAGKKVDFSAPYFTSIDGQVIMFPKYRKVVDNPFLPNSELPYSYVIDTQPVVTSTSSPSVKDSVKNKTTKPSTQYKMPKAVFETLMTNLPFKNSVECKSSSSSKPYYISKVDLLAYIKNNQNIAEYFPKNYKSLSKSELCDVVFGK